MNVIFIAIAILCLIWELSWWVCSVIYPHDHY